MDYKTRMRVAFGAILIFFLVLSGLILRPYLVAIASGFLLGYVFYPLYKYLLKRVKKKNISALIVTSLVLIVVLVPLFFLGKQALNQAKTAFVELTERIRSQELVAAEGCGEDASTLCWVNEEYKHLMEDEGVRNMLEPTLQSAQDWLWKKASGIILAVPGFVIDLVVTLLVMFGTLVEGDMMVEKLRNLIPLSRKDENVMFKRVHSTMHALIYGHITAALAQAVAGTIALLILGISSPIFWGALMWLTSMIPFVGAPIVWLPIAIGLIITGSVVKGIILFVWGIIVIGSIDNVIRTLVVSERTHMSMVVIFLGIAGGVSVFGFAGLIFGPLVLSLTATVLELYPEEHMGR